MKNSYQFIVMAFCVVLTPFLSCNQDSAQTYTLENAPEGYQFTNTSGEVLTSLKSNADDMTVQLRSEEGSVDLEFTVTGSVDLDRLTLERDLETVFINYDFPGDEISIDGIDTELTVYVPCNPMHNAVRFCYDITAQDEILPTCEFQSLPTTEEVYSGNVTWLNPERSGITDCAISVINSKSLLQAGGAQGTLLMPSSFSVTPPVDFVSNPETDPACAFLCDDPTYDLGGYEAHFFCNDPIVQLPTDSMDGTQLSCQLTYENTEFHTQYFESNSLNWTFTGDERVALDAQQFNFLLKGQQLELLECQLTCEMFVEGDADLSFFVNGQDSFTYTLTGYDTDNVYFLDPNFSTPEHNYLDGGVEGTDTLVVTDGNTDTPLDIVLESYDFDDVVGFEVIDLNNGVENTISVDHVSLSNTSDTGTLKILGTSLDTVRTSIVAEDSYEEDGIEFTQLTLLDGKILYVQSGINIIY